MQLNELQPAHGATRKRRRIGRGIGSGLGKTAGRGHKGQGSRSGASIKASFEGGQMPLNRRLPKRGFNSRKKHLRATIATRDLAKIESPVINLDVLRKAGLVTRDQESAKIIFSGSLEKAVTVEGIAVSKGALSSIQNAGGSVQD